MAKKMYCILGRELPECLFVQQLKGTEKLNYDGKPMPIYYFNVVQLRHQLALWSSNIRPWRGWQVGIVYEYFGQPKARNHQPMLSWLTDLIEAMQKGDTIVVVEEAQQ